MGDHTTTGPWAEDPLGGSEYWSDQYRRSLVNSQAVRDHGQGVDPDHLADYIMDMAAFAAQRVMTVGSEQYGGDIQKFETKSIEDLKQDALEEAADLVAYAAMILIKIQSLESTQSVGSE